MIDEATLEDDKPEMALAKGHCTFGQAIDVGTRWVVGFLLSGVEPGRGDGRSLTRGFVIWDDRMEAKWLLLNHFSQRYPKSPVCSPAWMAPRTTGRPVIALAFDLMTLPLRDFWKMEHYTEALEELFVEVEGGESEDGRSEVGDEVDEGMKGKAGGKVKVGTKEKVGGEAVATKAGGKRKRENKGRWWT